MLLRTKVNNLGEDLDDTRFELSRLIRYINEVLVTNTNSTAEDLADLIDEIGSNGVVRDLRKLEKRQANFERQVLSELEGLHSRFAQLDRNGVATAINNLHAEVFHDRRQVERSALESVFMAQAGVDPAADVEPTLAGKVEAIVEHLGLDVTVKPQKVEEAKVVAKKVKTTKKGRR